MVVEQEGFIGLVWEPREAANPKIKQIEKKTPKMREVERRFERRFAQLGVTMHIPIELILHFLSQGEGVRNKADIARFIRRVSGVKVGQHAVGDWLTKAGLEGPTHSEAARLSWENPKTRARREKGIKEAWRGKGRKKIMEGVERVVKERRKRVRKRVEQKLEVLVPERRTLRGRLRLLLVREGTKEKIVRRLGIQRDRLNQLLKEEKIDFNYSPPAKLSEENVKVVRLAKEGLLAELTPLQRQVIDLRYREDNPLILREVGRRLGRTKQAINYVEQTALRRLRRKLDIPDE